MQRTAASLSHVRICVPRKHGTDILCIARLDGLYQGTIELGDLAHVAVLQLIRVNACRSRLLQRLRLAMVGDMSAGAA